MRVAYAGLLVGAALTACGSAPRDTPTAEDSASAKGRSCGAHLPAPERLPGTRQEHLRLSYWLEQVGTRHDLDEPVLTAAQIEQHNAAVGRRGDGHDFSQHDLLAPLDKAELQRQVDERLEFMRPLVGAGQYVTADGERLEPERAAAFDARSLSGAQGSLRVALEPVQVHCGPHLAPLYRDDGGQVYDRNACSTLSPQDLVQVIAPWSHGTTLVRNRFALGWIPSDAPLSPPVPERLQEVVVDGPRRVASGEVTLRLKDGGTAKLGQHVSVPEHDGSVLVATRGGLVRAAIPEALVPTSRPLTRGALLRTAFEFLDSPYGYGGAGGGRDCSRLMLDLFAAFDLALPRHSGWQAEAGSFRIDVRGTDDEQERLALLDLAQDHGVVLLYFPGHIMLYLGRDEQGTPMALHALGEYAVPCEGEPEGDNVVLAQRVTVSDLEVGRGSSRGAFIERLTHMVVFGRPPEAALQGVAETRPAAPSALPEDGARCGDSIDDRIFFSPRRPVKGQPARVIAASTDNPGTARLQLWNPSGQRVEELEVKELGGPPYGQWVKLTPSSAGRWTAMLSDGERIVACKRLRVSPHPIAREETTPEAPVWEPRWKWERDTENLWALFVEQLFDYPPDDPRTWTNLHDVLRDEERNLLYDHLGLNEEEQLELVPDCADLPYSLRAYFAWKLRLPFGFRQCSRGAVGVPPRCGPLNTNLMEREFSDELDAFQRFAHRRVRWGVHSASGRTHPEDEDTDFYPVALTRRALTPGTTYADPYGHVMMLTRWVPQGLGDDSVGVLMAAEAQPDGTVGRRRFWQGSFLFDPSTEHVGAGFKHFRPLVYERDPASIQPLDHEAINRREDFADFSMQQYRIEREEFYDRMDALINPRPLDPGMRLAGLVEAFYESVKRRVLAVQNGEEFMAQRDYAPIEMPKGHAIFETTGPWEDYSTPSRDMRLFISLDTVTEFHEAVRRAPERFGASTEGLDPLIAKLQKQLAKELEQRHITYTRSDGSEKKLSLAEVVARSKALEMAYNPNDCIEIRWGAPEGSEERKTCKRRAPEAQRKRMARYREWFRTRVRPARDVHE